MAELSHDAVALCVKSREILRSVVQLCNRGTRQKPIKEIWRLATAEAIVLDKIERTARRQ
jgi:hypothetical protein